jgi:hypothetical protein
MKSLLIAALVASVTAAAGLSPALADGPRASGGNAIHEASKTGTPHYEWQYGYVGRHPRYQAHWVLVR